jgi:hypothetical protein
MDLSLIKQTCKYCKEHKHISDFFRSKIELENSTTKSIPKVCKDCRYKKLLKEDFLKNVATANRYENFTLAEYEYIQACQKDRCAICGRHSSELNKKLCVDHCHKTGKVRGLLCINCNLGLGSFKDDIKFLNKAIEYLKNSKINK